MSEKQRGVFPNYAASKNIPGTLAHFTEWLLRLKDRHNDRQNWDRVKDCELVLHVISVYELQENAALDALGGHDPISDVDR